MINSWLDALDIGNESKTPNVAFNLADLARADKEFDDPLWGPVAVSNEADWMKFQRVNDRKVAVVDRLERSDLSNARRFTQDLVSSQISHGDAEFAAKTLCSLAQEAKRLGHVSLQLEWTVEATKVYPNDPWPFAQAGDAYMSLFRYDEANQYFDLAEAKGDHHYGRRGKARIAMLTGKPEEALKALKELVDAYPDHKDTALAWLGIGDVQRSIGKPHEALASYEQAFERFPDRDEALCGKAAVLSQSQCRDYSGVGGIS